MTTTTTTATQTALVGGPKGDIILSRGAPCPPQPLEADQVAIAVKAVALNPVDTKMTGGYHTPGAIGGCECAGIVTAAGANATKEWGFSAGDRVAAVVMGMNPLRPHIGAFAEHVVSEACATLRIPDDWSFAQAAGGIGGNAWVTVPWALFHAMGLPAGPRLEPLHSELPPPAMDGFKIPIRTDTDGSAGPPTMVLVSGGASFTGTCAIQLLKLAGFTVVATCSARNFELARSFGADAVFDYASPTCAEDIRAHTRNCLRLVLDCITTPDTTRLCYAAMGRAGGRYVALDPYSMAVAGTRGVVRPDWVFGLELLGEDVAWPAPHGREANPAAKKFCEVWNRTMQGLLERKLIRPHPQLIRETGLAGALNGLEDLRTKKVSGKKLIYTL